MSIVGLMLALGACAAHESAAEASSERKEAAPQPVAPEAESEPAPALAPPLVNGPARSRAPVPEYDRSCKRHRDCVNIDSSVSPSGGCCRRRMNIVNVEYADKLERYCQDPRTMVLPQNCSMPRWKKWDKLRCVEQVCTTSRGKRPANGRKWPKARHLEWERAEAVVAED